MDNENILKELENIKKITENIEKRISFLESNIEQPSCVKGLSSQKMHNLKLKIPHILVAFSFIVISILSIYFPTYLFGPPSGNFGIKWQTTNAPQSNLLQDRVLVEQDTDIPKIYLFSDDASSGIINSPTLNLTGSYWTGATAAFASFKLRNIPKRVGNFVTGSETRVLKFIYSSIIFLNSIGSNPFILYFLFFPSLK